jgi:integrase
VARRAPGRASQGRARALAPGLRRRRRRLDRDPCPGYAAVDSGVRGSRWPRATQRGGGSAQAASGRARREGQALTLQELWELTEACEGRYRDVVPVLALAGLRWGELAGLQVGDRVSVPGPGLRLRRTVLASGGGALYVDTLKNNRARTVPLILDLLPIVDRWSAGKTPDAWLFSAPEGGPLRESNWKRSVGWSAATSAVGANGFRVHDLRHTAASVWLAAGADPKVVQRVLGHATAAMTMDLYGHMIDANLWRAARLIGDISGTSEPSERGIRTDSEPGKGAKNP